MKWDGVMLVMGEAIDEAVMDKGEGVLEDLSGCSRRGDHRRWRRWSLATGNEAEVNMIEWERS